MKESPMSPAFQCHFLYFFFRSSCSTKEVRVHDTSEIRFFQIYLKINQVLICGKSSLQQNLNIGKLFVASLKIVCSFCDFREFWSRFTDLLL